MHGNLAVIDGMNDGFHSWIVFTMNKIENFPLLNNSVLTLNFTAMLSPLNPKLRKWLTLLSAIVFCGQFNEFQVHIHYRKENDLLEAALAWQFAIYSRGSRFVKLWNFVSAVKRPSSGSVLINFVSVRRLHVCTAHIVQITLFVCASWMFVWMTWGQKLIEQKGARILWKLKPNATLTYRVFQRILSKV